MKNLCDKCQILTSVLFFNHISKHTNTLQIYSYWYVQQFPPIDKSKLNLLVKCKYCEFGLDADILTLTVEF